MRAIFELESIYIWQNILYKKIENLKVNKNGPFEDPAEVLTEV